MDRGKRYNDEARCVIDRFPRQDKAAVQEEAQDPVNEVSDKQIVDWAQQVIKGCMLMGIDLHVLFFH